MRLGLFLVGGDLVQQGLQHAGRFAGLDQVAEQVVEIQGCLRRASAREVPLSTSALMPRIRSCIVGLSWPRPTISNDCTSGTPADIMVASWRLKIAMSLVVIFFLRGGDGHQLHLNLKIAPIRLKLGTNSQFGELIPNPVSVSGVWTRSPN